MGEVSPDGKWYWDGQRWLSTLSPDGRSRWDGNQWTAIQSTRPVGAGWAARHPIRVAAIGGGALAAIVVTALIVAAAVNSGPTPSTKAQLDTTQRQSPAPSAVATVRPAAAHSA